MDVSRWIDYWASLKVDALLLNGGGIVAYYPTEVPHHHRSEFLGSRDLFGELVAATRARGIRVVARMDCNYAYEPAVKAHPEWFEREEDGPLRPHGEPPWLFKTCMFSRISRSRCRQSTARSTTAVASLLGHARTQLNNVHS
jgi:hypothetical protein